MICYDYSKDGMLDYFKQLLVREHTYEDEELRNLINLFTLIPVREAAKI